MTTGGSLPGGACGVHTELWRWGAQGQSCQHLPLNPPPHHHHHRRRHGAHTLEPVQHSSTGADVRHLILLWNLGGTRVYSHSVNSTLPICSEMLAQRCKASLSPLSGFCNAAGGWCASAGPHLELCPDPVTHPSLNVQPGLALEAVPLWQACQLHDLKLWADEAHKHCEDRSHQYADQTLYKSK